MSLAPLLGVLALEVREPELAAAPPPLPVDETPLENDPTLHLLSEAETMLRLGRAHTAAKLAAELWPGDPHRDAVRRFQAWAFTEAGQFQDVLRALGETETLDGELAYLRGGAYAAVGDHGRAQRDLQAVWWREPAGVWGPSALRALADLPQMYSAAEAAVIREHTRAAGPFSARQPRATRVAVLEALLAHAPAGSRLQAELLRAVALLQLEQEELQAAVKTLGRAARIVGGNKALASSPLRRAIELAWGEAERRRGALDEASAHFRSASAGHADLLAQEAASRAGQMFIEHRRYREAKAHFEDALVTNPVGPGRGAALWGLGWVAYRTGDFQQARRFFTTLLREDPYGPRASAALYWSARALEELAGAPQQVRAELAAVIETFPLSYDAHRAQERLGDGPLPSPAPLPARRHPRVEAVAELMDVAMYGRAERAISAMLQDGLVNHLGPEDLSFLAEVARRVSAPKLAQRLTRQRHDRFVDSSEAWRQSWASRFPAQIVAMLRQEARAQRVDEDLVVALVYRESRFNIRAASSVGALGLMQLMPSTAAELLREERRRARPSAEDILQPETNIRLGVRYLARMLRTFRKRPELALAAYNAGPGAVTKWRSARGELPEEIFVEEIPYSETQSYVRNVLATRRALVALREAEARATSTSVAEAGTQEEASAASTTLAEASTTATVAKAVVTSTTVEASAKEDATARSTPRR